MIEVKHLSKFYGSFQAVKDLSFTIPDGHVYGFLGPNGAGKSTTMNMITGCLSPSDGRILIDGFDIYEEPTQAKKRIGYLPEQPPLYMHETPEEYLQFVGEAKGIRGKALAAQIEEVLEKTKLQDVHCRRISALSKGYRQRVGIAQALLGNPTVIILDEPTVGLDPIQILQIRELIRELGQTHTVVLSSHILSEIQTICEEILIISKGELVAFDTPENLEAQMLCSRIHLITEASPAEAETILKSMDLRADSVSADRQGFTDLTLSAEERSMTETCRRLFFRFAQAKKAILELRPQKATLEDIFLQLTETDSAEDAECEEEEV